MILGLFEEAVVAGARVQRASEVLGLSLRTLERWQRQGGGEDRRAGPKKPPANKLSPEEREHALRVVNSPEFSELSPKQIVPQLADQKRYVASESTLYRLLRQEGQLQHRQRSRPPQAQRPRALVAHGPNQVHSWDITYLPSPVRGQFFYLYLILDVWSRKIVGARVYAEESTDLASELFLEVCQNEVVDPTGLSLHSDNGSVMKGSTLQATLRRLGISSSFSRPRVSNDNPYSEALFRTLKYRAQYPPECFLSLAEAQQWVEGFVAWYNHEHLHSALRFISPEDRHNGEDKQILAARRQVYEEARQRHPERWSGPLRNWEPVGTVYLNVPKEARQSGQAQTVAEC